MTCWMMVRYEKDFILASPAISLCARTRPSPHLCSRAELTGLRLSCSRLDPDRKRRDLPGSMGSFLLQWQSSVCNKGQ